MSGDDSDVESDVSIEWLLGFVDPPQRPNDLLRHRFPSKVGGRPAWLNPIDLPTAKQLTCAATGKVMQFLIQVYAPTDENSNAFHRSLYVFASPDGSKLTAPGAVRALRCQLPRRNSFYPFDPPKKENKLPPALPADQLEAALAKDPWRAESHAAAVAAAASERTSKNSSGNAAADREVGEDASCPALFEELELVVEPEPEESETEEGGKAAAAFEQFKQRTAEEGEYDEEELPRDVVDSIEDAATEDQRHFAAFAARVAREPSQVLRYCFEDAASPLCPGAGGVPGPADVPNCPRCGGPRRFEFQVMPQLLNHLGVDPSNPKAPDWGTVAIFSCAASCGGGQGSGATGGGEGEESAYVEEWVWVQPPL